MQVWTEGIYKGGKTPGLSWNVCQAVGFKRSGSLAPFVHIAGSKALQESLKQIQDGVRES